MFRSSFAKRTTGRYHREESLSSFRCYFLLILKQSLWIHLLYKLHKKASSLLSEFVIIVSLEFVKFTGKLVTYDKLETLFISNLVKLKE